MAVEPAVETRLIVMMVVVVLSGSDSDAGGRRLVVFWWDELAVWPCPRSVDTGHAGHAGHAVETDDLREHVGIH